MAGLNDWSKSASGNNIQGDINFAEGQNPASLNDSSREAMADAAKQRDDTSGAVKTTGAAGVYAMTPNATATNQTTGLMVRVQINHDSPSGGCTFNYGFKGAKAIKVIDSAGERDPNANELKLNAFCTMTYDEDANSSAGAWIATDIVTAALDTSNFALKVEAEGTKASAATCDIGSVIEYRVNVTGTTTITSFGSVANSRKLLRFTDALTLTHNATSLILPGEADITTAAGDVAEFVSDGSGNWRCVSFQRQNGTPVKSIISVPTGAILAHTSSIVPAGFLEADGAAVSRTNYAALFAEIGTNYGTGDGSSTFNIPDLRGEFVRGWDHGAGNDPDASSRTDRGDGTAGDNIGTKQADEFESHTHGINTTNAGAGYAGGVTYNQTNPSQTDATGGAETRPRNIALMYIIKY